MWGYEWYYYIYVVDHYFDPQMFLGVNVLEPHLNIREASYGYHHNLSSIRHPHLKAISVITPFTVILISKHFNLKYPTIVSYDYIHVTAKYFILYQLLLTIHKIISVAQKRSRGQVPQPVHFIHIMSVFDLTPFTRLENGLQIA